VTFRHSRLALAVAFLAAAVIPPADPSLAQASASLTFKNTSKSAIIRFYVDGQRSCSANPGEFCSDATSVGTHTIGARFEDPRYQDTPACVSESVYVPADGLTWKC
jgi:hypothetical protein